MKFRGILAGLVAASIWGGMYVSSKLVLRVFPPFILLNFRLIIAALTIWMVLRFQGWKGFSKRNFIKIFGIGFLGFGVSIGSQLFGTRLSTAANGAVITSSVPAFVFLFAFIILKEKVTFLKIIALVISSIGVFIIIDFKVAELAPKLFWGNLALGFAAFTWALYSVLIKKFSPGLKMLPVTFVSILGGIAVSIPLGVWEYQNEIIGAVSLGVVAGILYLSIISTALAAFLWNTAFETLDAGVASLTLFAQPIIGTILSIIILDESLSLSFIIGSVLVGVGLLLVAKET